LDGLSKAILQLNNNPNILETGTSAWGCDSSRLFDSLVREFGGQFVSVDMRKEASQWLKFQHCDRTKFVTKNSIDFIKEDLESLGFSHIDLCYLDSLDVDYCKPLESAEHHLNELNAIRPFLRSGSIVIIDDQPSNLNEIPKEFQEISTEVFSKMGFLPGKATLILREIEKMDDFSIILWKRSVVIQLK
jgi:predicted O-methyltransferase YrrM